MLAEHEHLEEQTSSQSLPVLPVPMAVFDQGGRRTRAPCAAQRAVQREPAPRGVSVPLPQSNTHVLPENSSVWKRALNALAARLEWKYCLCIESLLLNQWATAPPCSLF